MFGVNFPEEYKTYARTDNYIVCNDNKLGVPEHPPKCRESSVRTVELPTHCTFTGTTAIAAMVLWPIHMQYGLRKASATHATVYFYFGAQPGVRANVHTQHPFLCVFWLILPEPG